MREKRDTQRQRLYRAEGILNRSENNSKYAKGLDGSIESCQKYIDTITTHAWFRRRWGTVYIKVVVGKGARGGGGVIRLGKWARNEAVMLHELAHNLVPNNYAAHGPEFAGVMLFLVKQVIGKESADKLRDSYKAQKVKTNRKCLPKPERKVQSMAALKREASQANKEPLSRWEYNNLTKLLEQAIKSGAFGDGASRKRQQARAVLNNLKRNGR